MTKRAIAFGITDAVMIFDALREWECFQGNHNYHPEDQAKLDPRFRDPQAAEKLAQHNRDIARNRKMRLRIARHAQRLLAEDDAANDRRTVGGKAGT